MRRALRFALGGLTVMLLLLGVAGVLVLRSDWFYEQLRHRVITEIQKSTGGKVEIGALRFDPHALVADVDGLSIRGTEPSNEPALFSADKATIGLKLVSLAKHQVDIASLALHQPRINLIISAGGRTNIPTPQTPLSGKPIDQTILDIAIGSFDIENGTVRIESAAGPAQQFPWTANGENLKAHFNYRPERYTGRVSIQPVRFRYDNTAAVDAAIDAAITFERDHIQVSSARMQTASSSLEFAGDAHYLNSPEYTGRYQAHIAADEAARLLRWRSRQNGTIHASGDFRFKTAGDFLVSGKLRGSELTYRDPDLHFDHLQVQSNFIAEPGKIVMSNLHATLIGGQVQGRVTLTGLDHFDIKGNLAGFAADSVAALLRTTPPPVDFRFSGPFEARGSIERLKDRRVDASAQLTLSAAGKTPVSGFVDVRFDGTRQYADFASSFFSLPSTRLDFSGGVAIEKEAYNAQLAVRLASSNLDDALILAPAIKSVPVTLGHGHAQFEGTVSGPLASPLIAGHITANHMLIEKQNIDAFSADVNAASTGLQVRNGVLAYQNMRARVDGNLGLRQWKPENSSAVNAAISLQNADIAHVLALLGQTQVPARGPLTAEARVNGTLADPHATATLRAGSGSAYGEHFDRATAKVAYVTGGLQEFNVEAGAGTRNITLSGTFQHSPSDFLDGVIRANLRTSDVRLNQIERVRQQQPAIGGVARATADAEIRVTRAKAGAQFAIVSLNADVLTRNLSLEEKQLGDVHVTAHTAAGQNPPLLNLQLESNLAHSTLRGGGSWQLGGDYPGSGELTFTAVNLAELRRMFAPNALNLSSVGGTVEGKITFSGSAQKPQTLTGALEIPKLEIRPDPGGKIPIPDTLRDLVIRNQGPIRAAMTNGVIRVESARVTARSTDVSLLGTINLNNQNPLNLRAAGNLDLSILPMFERDLVSSGTVAATATIRGNFAQPDILGRLDVRNANLNLEGLPNGLSNANGTVIFDPSRATIQSLTAETGGGKVDLTGFLVFSNGPMAMRLVADAKEVRVRYPEGVSTVADAQLRLIGTTERSTLSGTITIRRSALNLNTDIGRLLANATAPVQTPAVQTGLVGNMQFDIDVVTAPDVSFQTSLAQGLQADANLRLRGTLSNPVLLGRVNISQGELMFFGNKYTIDEGTISFFNPVRLEPVLDISLETRARSVDVSINVTGPINKLNASYRSDPPLQFADLVALLATGRTPENPTIAAREPGTTQTWQEMGASALLGQAIANPLAGRLQRFFGVSKIKIDPLLTGVAGNAQARLTIEQNVTPDLTFTYITNVASATGSAQVIRVEWDFSRHWSAVAVRDEYGYFGIDFQYRKRLK